MLLVSLFSFPVLIGTVFATSEVSPSLRTRAQSKCSLSGSFQGEEFSGKKVFWKFKNLSAEDGSSGSSSADCSNLPDLFQVRIPPGQYSEKLKSFIYPEFVTPPELGETFRLTLVFFPTTSGSEAQFVDWRTGYRRSK